ncbi:putative Zn(2)-C6 fungal-type domain-containing protein [Seiridium cardinale]
MSSEPGQGGPPALSPESPDDDGPEIDASSSNNKRRREPGGNPSARKRTTYAKRRSAVACDVCRTRRTKCDGRTVCWYCQQHNLECTYRALPEPAPSKVEQDISAIRKELEALGQRLSQNGAQPPAARPFDGFTSMNGVMKEVATGGMYTTSFPAYLQGFPFMTLQTGSFMSLVGLDGNLAKSIVAIERENESDLSAANSSRFFMLQRENIEDAVTAFMLHIYPWFPILKPSFVAEYRDVLSEGDSRSSKTCLVLTVAGLGAFVSESMSRSSPGSSTGYISQAIAMLPTIILRADVVSIQCLVILSLHLNSWNHELEQVARTYWAVLFLESELAIQIDLAESGIWSLSEEVGLPSSFCDWNETHTSSATSTPIPRSQEPSPASSPSVEIPREIKNLAKISQEYFLAEIAIRRMLRRCGTAISPDLAIEGVVFAPIIAAEMESQLNEWHNLLPPSMHFETGPAIQTPFSSSSNYDVLDIFANNFNAAAVHVEKRDTGAGLPMYLCAQYHSCRASIYWPAAVQAIRRSAKGGVQMHMDPVLLQGCSNFFEAYARFIPTAICFLDGANAQPNMWEMGARVFAYTIAALKAITISNICCSAHGGVSCHIVFLCIEKASTAIEELSHTSPSLAFMSLRLKEKLAETPRDALPCLAPLPVNVST